ncbi:enhancer of filamentation 1 [Indicator indicator]|uniref:enhancer of filamentation 1 n=1 Tax=Indicator indicator TaxID=1002788 RepID=UPI0023DFB697|nr:enhancer of filamentation 1 [Indicator indicator]
MGGKEAFFLSVGRCLFDQRWLTVRARYLGKGGFLWDVRHWCRTGIDASLRDNLMARALYDNVPECAEELAFRKGDILTVIEQNTEGLEGWWLCSLHGRQGIVPGNRVKLLIGPVVQDNPPGQDISSSGLMPQSFNQQKIYQVPSSHASARDPVYQVPPSHVNQGIYQIPTGHGVVGQDIYQVPPSMQRPIDGPGLTNKVIIPVRSGQGYVYEFPSNYQKDTYDIPPVRPLQGIYDIPPTSVKVPALPVPMGEAKTLGIYDIPPAKGVYATPPSACRDDTGLRENLQEFSSSVAHSVHSVRPEGVYDIPPPITKATGKELHKFSPESRLLPDGVPQKQCVYDIPLNHQNHFLGQQIAPQKDVYDTPRGVSFPGQQTGLSESLISEGREGVYDVPPPVLQDTKGLQDVTDGINRLSFSSTGSTRSNMSTSSTASKDSFSAATAQEKRLILDPDTAIERLYHLQQTVETAVNNLMAFITADWRSYGYMEKHINEIHTAVDKVEQSLLEYLQFAKGSAANASCLPEVSLLNKMRREVQRLEDSHQILTQTSHDLNSYNWSLNVLAVNRLQNKCDDLDRFVMVARTVPDDAKQLTTTISVNAEVLFKPVSSTSRFKTLPENIMNAPDYVYDNPHMQCHGEKAQNHCSPLPPLLSKAQPPHNATSDSSEKSWMDDYDYVHLQGKEEFERQQKELLEKENIIKQSKLELEHHQINQFQRLEQEITKPVENDISKWKPAQALQTANSTATSRDSQLLLFYSDQCETHFNSLLNAIDAFFSCVNASQPPRIFVAHSKFVILSAHKLVFIGDMLTRQVMTQDIRNKVMNSSNQLCEQLKSIVLATKMAALQYPNTAALQKMVDRVTELSHHAQLFKLSLVQMASL